MVEAYRDVGGELPLVMVGGAPYAGEFIASFSRRADPRVRFPGPIYGRGYRQLLSHAAAYIHATEVGGTHPALVEAMGYGNCLVVNDTPENREVAGDAALYFRAHTPGTLAAALERRAPASGRGRRAAARGGTPCRRTLLVGTGRGSLRAAVPRDRRKVAPGAAGRARDG